MAIENRAFRTCQSCGQALALIHFPLVNPYDCYDCRRAVTCDICDRNKALAAKGKPGKWVPSDSYTPEGRRKQKANRQAQAAKRRSQKLNSTPPWVNHAEIKLIYQLCVAESHRTKVLHHVDHIVPLIHPLVCGLHVPWNLQIIPAKLNLSKSNRLITKKDVARWPLKR